MRKLMLQTLLQYNKTNLMGMGKHPDPQIIETIDPGSMYAGSTVGSPLQLFWLHWLHVNNFPALMYGHAKESEQTLSHLKDAPITAFQLHTHWYRDASVGKMIRIMSIVFYGSHANNLT